jgi:DNA-binding MarR family transcriptional regulator
VSGEAGVRTAAEEFDRLFQGVYLAFHRRDGKRAELTGASRAVLNHLALAGPLTVGEAAVHLDRAQSVVSDIVSGLQDKGLLEREPDPADRRRTLVWLTPAGFDRLARDRRVLSAELLTEALAAVPPHLRDGLLAGLRALLAPPGPAPSGTENPTPEEER